MRRLYFIICSLLFIASLSNTVEAQSLMQTAKKAEQRAKELKQQENSRYHAILDSHDLSKYEQFLKDYPNSRNTKEIKKRAEEIRLWNNAKNKNSILAYENYLNNSMYLWYDNEAIEAIRNIKKVSEKQAWEKVVGENTIEAYQLYLNDNPATAYKIEAENAIKRFLEEKAWQKIRTSNDVVELENFINTYPNAKEISSVTTRLHELKGVELYNNGKLYEAYAEFSKIKKNQMSPINYRAYDESMEFYEFHRLGDHASENDLIAFLRKYPNGKYYNQVSNKIALGKARVLGYNSTDFEYSNALNYVKDEDTRKKVYSYIAMSRKMKANREKAYKKLERNGNGGLFNLGFDFMDIGFNGDNDLWYYNIGLMLRLGNFKDRIQVAVGIKPGWFMYSESNYDYYDYFDYSYEYTENRIKFHMPFVGQLKLNLFNISDNSRFFIYGEYQYNAIRIKQIEGKMSWGIGCGFAWKHFDWSFYYRNDIGIIDNSEFKAPNFWGMSMIYYCQL